MQLITAESVEQVCTRMWNMSEGDAFKLSYLMEKEQPVLLAYLAAVDKNILNQPERELMFYLATAVSIVAFVSYVVWGFRRAFALGGDKI